MSEWRHCPIHGVEYHRENGCPDCQVAENCAAADRTDLLQAISNLKSAAVHAAEHAAFRQSNPGDYECPSCKFKTLLYDAPLCWKCQRSVGDEYWKDVRRVEKAAALQAEEAAERGKQTEAVRALRASFRRP
jgi:ribosomal protein L37AE/L43A